MITASSRPASPVTTDYDVVVIGGAFAGCATALLIRRFAPRARVLIVERQRAHARKVGEATVELSGCFLQRELGLYDYLSREHLPKHGLRYWFTDNPDRTLSEMSEIGPREQPRLPSFQLDRAKLDEYLLERARLAGCTVERPVNVRDIALDWPASEVSFASTGAGDRQAAKTVSTRWVIDASGRRAFISRKLDLQRRVPAHPTSAMWARWDGVRDLDDEHVRRANALADVAASRRLATNHFCGYGWWCWVIPLKGGQTSIGLVFNHELIDVRPDMKRPRERYESFVRGQPGLRELLEGATMCDGDFMTLKHVPYATKAYADTGWAIVGDAASFMDPYYSPGLDHGAISSYATARLVARDLNAALSQTELAHAVREHNARFLRSFDRWISALYLDKYELMGDAELMTCAYWIDTAAYFLGVVGPVYADSEALANPVFGVPVPQTAVAYELMRFVNRRLLALARRRRESGRYGRRNVGWRCYTAPFAVGAGALPPLARGLRLWLKLEVATLLDRVRMRHVDKARKVAVSQ